MSSIRGKHPMLQNSHKDGDHNIVNGVKTPCTKVVVSLSKRVVF